MDTTVLFVLLLILGLVGVSILVSLLLHRSSQLQLRYVQEQLQLGRDARKTQNLVHALSILRDQDFRSAVMVVRNRMVNKPLESWEAGDTFHVLLVCSTYNMVGLLVKHGLVAREVFVEHWGKSVVDTYEALAEFIENRQIKSPLFCADYQWLYLQCREAAVSEAPSSEMPMASRGGGPRRSS